LLGEETEELPSKSDLYIGIKVSSNGCSGNNDQSVLGEEFRNICKALVRLNKKRKGEAVLSSFSPNELEIKVYSVSSLGAWLFRAVQAIKYLWKIIRFFIK
jgi:hypothetical protein